MLFTAVVVVSFGCAIAFRRWSPAGEWLSVAAITLLAVLGGMAAGLSIMEAVDGWWRPVLALAGAIVIAQILTHLGAAINRYALDPLRRTVEQRLPEEDVLTRLEHRADRREVSHDRVNLYSLGVRSIRRTIDVRVTGLAAEMSYYGLISLVPLATALGASLGFLERILGTDQVDAIEAALVDAVAGIFAEDVAAEILTPLIEGLLRNERAGIAIGSVLVVLWLASRMFRAAIRALDDAYGVTERRNLVAQQVLGLALALGAVITLLVLLAMVVVGPLLGDGQEIADQLGLGRFFEVAWAVLRWPAVALICAVYLTIVHRFAPNVDTVWTRCIPGAVLSTVGLIAVTIGFGAVLDQTGISVVAVDAQSSAVSAAAQTIGVILAGVLWLWLSSIVILVGGVLNAELDRSVTVPPEADSRNRAASTPGNG